MVHCDPAPPHPPPGEIYNVVCPPDGGWMPVLLVIGFLMLIIGIYVHRHAEAAGGDSA